MRLADAGRLVLLAAIWGSSFLFIKVGLEDLSPIQIVTVRLVLGGGLLLALVLLRGMSLPSGREGWAALTFMALFGNIVPFLLITWGEERITSGLAAILNSTTPLFTAFIASAVIHDERLNAVRLAGIVLGFLGVAVVVGFDTGGSELIGQLAVLVASSSYGMTFVFAKKRLAHEGSSPMLLSAAQVSLAAALMLPAGAWDLTMHRPAFGAAAWLSVAALGIAGTGFAYVIYYRLIRDVGPTSASLSIYLVPLFGVVLGWLLLGETLGANALLGAVLVIAGIALAERGGAWAQRRRAEMEAEPVGADGSPR